MEKLNLTGYSSLLARVRKRVRDAQYQALKTVNRELIGLYWDIGRMIHERQKGNTWGKSVVHRLATDLREGIPRHEWIFSPKSVADEAILRDLPA